MSSRSGFRRSLVGLLFGAVVVASAQAGCGDTVGSHFSEKWDASDPGEPPPVFEQNGDDGGGGSSSGGNADAAGILDVSPATATVDVTIVDGVVTAAAQPFVASYDGTPVAATWLLDRGELGDIDAAGVFNASGKHVGEAVVTARYGAREGTAKVKVNVRATQNGAGEAPGTGGAGGLGGVGGEALDTREVPSNIVADLKTKSNPPASESELGFLYPYDRTVWPRGLLPPLLMWQTNKTATAVYVKLSQSNYAFEGTYMLDAQSGDARKRVRLENAPWTAATSGNQGDDLKLELKIYAADGQVYGPITRTWKVAPGVLKGTVYYNSYNSPMTAVGGKESGGVIAIKPRSPDPELAIPSMKGQCHACHVVSADGSTLFAQDGHVDSAGRNDYRDGASYDLKNPAAARVAYPGRTDEKYNRVFVWSAPYPDGSFALTSYGYAREAYGQAPSGLVKKDGTTKIPSTNIDKVTSAVTPAFSPDGRKVVFNFWAGPGIAPVTAGAGHSLALFDFSCGAAAGSVACAPGTTPGFSNLRELYRDSTRWPGWPSFTPDAKAVVFHNTLEAADQGTGNLCRADIVHPPPETTNCQLTTWKTPVATSTGATAEIWLAHDSASPTPRRLDALNGFGPTGTSYLPTSATHPNDTKLNYMPTVNPVASGGYYWVVFTSRRLYGNVLTEHPHETYGGRQKKLWVAAIDINNPNPLADPSHPAFYLPGQEINADNTRGFWVVDPCKANGTSCETGDECCNGFCRKDEKSGGLVCQDQPPGGQCAEEFEKCTIDADCCDPAFQCIGGKCTRPGPGGVK